MTPQETNITAVDISTIHKDGTQSRKKLDDKTVRDIRDDIRDGNPISPIVLFFDGMDHWIADGYHRVEAHLKEKRDLIQADIRRGTKDEALRYNIQSNASADQTRWTNADKRNAVTLLLQSYGAAEVARSRAEEIAAMAKCGHALVYKVLAELKATDDSSAPRKSKPITVTQPPVATAESGSVHIDNDDDVRDEHEPTQAPSGDDAEPERPVNKRSKARNARQDVANAKARDRQIAALAAEKYSQAEIARKLEISPSLVSDSFRRQKLTPELINPLVKILERAQITASEWEGMDSMLRSGDGRAAQWPSATREQKKEVVGYLKKAIEWQTKFINRLTKEAKE